MLILKITSFTYNNYTIFVIQDQALLYERCALKTFNYELKMAFYFF